MRELMLRIEARLRVRKAVQDAATAAGPGGAEKAAAALTLRNLRVDETGHRVFDDDGEVLVSALEMRVLVFPIKPPGWMRTRREGITAVRGYQPAVASRTVDTHIKRLRDELGTAAALLQTVRGVGFRLANPDDQSSP